MPQQIQSAEMREQLRRLYARDPEARFVRSLVRRMADPVKPENEKGRFRPHPLVVWLGLISAVGASVFLYFSYLQP
jgi:hypothetical protein